MLTLLFAFASSAAAFHVSPALAHHSRAAVVPAQRPVFASATFGIDAGAVQPTPEHGAIEPVQASKRSNVLLRTGLTLTLSLLLPAIALASGAGAGEHLHLGQKVCTAATSSFNTLERCFPADLHAQSTELR